MLLFFGDHQPALSTIVNDALFSGEDDLAHNLRTHDTVYLMWANYDVAGGTTREVRDTSVCYLGASLAETIGMPLTTFQRAELAVREELPSLSLIGTQLADGTWVAYGEDDALPGSYADLASMAYLEFGRTVR